MAKPFNVNQVINYTLAEEKENPEGSVFHLGALDAQLEAYIYDKNKNESNWMLSYELVRFGLKGWDKFEAPFVTEEVHVPGIGKRTAVKLESMNSIKPYIAELALNIIIQSRLSGTDQKN